MWCLGVAIVTIALANVAVFGIDYELTFRTCDVDGADTNASAIITFLAEDGITNAEVTVPGGPNIFNRGSQDTVNNISLSFHGPVCSIRIRRTDAGPLEGWKLQQLDIHDGSRNAVFVINDCSMDDEWVTERGQTFTRSDNTSGNWGLWGEWLQKNKSLKCIRHRYRSCDNPKPICGAAKCPGGATDVRCVGQHHEDHFLYKTRYLKTNNIMAVLPTLLGVLLSFGSLFLTVVICFYLKGGSAVPVKTEDDHEKGDNSEATRERVVSPGVDQPTESAALEITPEQPSRETTRPEEEESIEERLRSAII